MREMMSDSTPSAECMIQTFRLSSAHAMAVRRLCADSRRIYQAARQRDCNHPQAIAEVFGPPVDDEVA